jgi:predicted cobalt transporter CbtA
MKYRTAFLTLLTVFFLTILTLVFTTPLLHAAEAGDAQKTPYVDAPAAGAPAPSRCSSMFEILDANDDHFIDKDEAKKSAETTAIWKNFDRDLDNRLSLEEFCAGTK